MEVKAERITPYDHERPKTEQVEEMFDSIAPAYDLMNRAMTFGIDKSWRAKAVKMLRQFPHANILDVATGTADLAIRMARDLHPAAITGIDLSEQMVAVGRRKVERAGLSGKITLTTGDCLALPMADNSFDCVTVAYGVRNFEHLDRGYLEMARVLRPGGTVCVIELSTPTSPIIKPLYKLYTRGIIPAIGRIVSNDRRAYTYLPESIAAVPQGEAMLQLMRHAGLTGCTCRPLTFGTCTIYLGHKPA